jgi:hypothetical protein
MVSVSCRGWHVFPNDPWMARCDAQECERSPFRPPAILFPIPQGVHTNSERFGKLSLRKPDESTKRSDVPWLKLATHDALTLTMAESSPEIALSKLRKFLHASFSMYSL